MKIKVIALLLTVNYLNFNSILSMMVRVPSAELVRVELAAHVIKSIESHADLNQRVNLYQDKESQLPLYYAVVYNFIDLAEKLLSKGADANVIIEYKGSREPILHTAIRLKRLAIINSLLDHGADHNARNEKGQTAWCITLETNVQDIFDIFKDRALDTKL